CLYTNLFFLFLSRFLFGCLLCFLRRYFFLNHFLCSLSYLLGYFLLGCFLNHFLFCCLGCGFFDNLTSGFLHFFGGLLHLLGGWFRLAGGLFRSGLFGCSLRSSFSFCRL